MRSHFTLARSAAIAAAVTGATALLTSPAAAQIAYDTASNPLYNPGWSAGQNGGTGFGAWSFNGTTSGTNSDAGAQQEMSTAAPLGTAWTLFNLPPVSGGTGISEAGRSIAGGLAATHTFETVIANPTGYHYFGGYDLLFFNGTDNLPAGNNNAALRISFFNSGYYNPGMDWSVNDASGHGTGLTEQTTAAKGVRIDLYMNSATTYTLTMTPLNGGTPFSMGGTLGSSLPIDFVTFRLYNTPSTGPNDTTDNYGISYMEVVPEPSSLALVGLGCSGLIFFRRRK